MLDITAPAVPTPQVTIATGGFATSDVLRNWVARGLFKTPSHLLPEPRAGKPRVFPLLAVYEAAMHAWGSKRGLPQSFMIHAWQFRIMRMLAQNGRSGGWQESDFAEGAAAGAMTEFQDIDRARPWFWVIATLATEDGKPHPRGLLLTQADGLGDAVATMSQEGGGALVINATDIIADVHERLRDAGWTSQEVRHQ
jgi:hypothetical protein